MRIIGAICLLAILKGDYVDGKKFEPCELAQEVYKILMATKGARAGDDPYLRALTKYLEDIPLIVCIAGYHKLNTSNEYSLRDGHFREGIFGLVRHAGSPKRTQFLDDDITDDLFELIESVLYVGYNVNPVTHDFYREACSQHPGPFCYLNEYVFGSYQILLPDNRWYLSNMYTDRKGR